MTRPGVSAVLVCVLMPMLCAVLLGGCQAQKALPQATSAGEEPEGESVVSATGKMMPVRWASLSFGATGTVREVLVSEGERVSEGQVLARLDLPELQTGLAQAEAAAKVARAQLDRLLATPRPVDLAGAEIAVDMARDGEVAAWLAAEVAQASITATQAAVSVARASVAKAGAGPSSDELEVARQNTELARNQLYAAQGQRDALGGLRQSGLAQPGAYESAKGQVLAAETSVTIAELQYRILASGAKPGDIAILRAQTVQTEAAVEVARAQETTAKQQAVTNKGLVRQAAAQLDLLKAPPREEDLAVARALVAQAEAAVQTARAALEKADLRAPFSGTVCEANLRVGEYVLMGVPLVTLGDLTALHVETTDLDEIDVARIAEGRKVTITLDALPGVRFGGTVREIALKASPGSGGTTYRAIIELDDAPDARMRWGMTAFTDIRTE